MCPDLQCKFDNNTLFLGVTEHLDELNPKCFVLCQKLLQSQFKCCLSPPILGSLNELINSLLYCGSASTFSHSLSQRSCSAVGMPLADDISSSDLAVFALYTRFNILPSDSCHWKRLRRYFAARLLQLTPVLIEVVLVLGRDFDQGRSGRPPSAAFQS